MDRNIGARMVQRNDTKANWERINPVLLTGELGIERDTNKVKIGDGTNHWNNLPYLVAESVNQEFEDYKAGRVNITFTMNTDELTQWPDGKEFYYSVPLPKSFLNPANPIYVSTEVIKAYAIRGGEKVEIGVGTGSRYDIGKIEYVEYGKARVLTLKENQMSDRLFEFKIALVLK